MESLVRSIGNENLRIVILALTLIFCVGGIAAAWAWSAMKTSEHRARLAALLLDRGFKPHEIEQVLRAVQHKPDAESEAADGPLTSAEAEVRLMNVLTDQSYEAEDVQKVLAAARDAGPIDRSTIKLVESLAEEWYEADDMAKLLRDRKQRPANIKQHPAVA